MVQVFFYHMACDTLVTMITVAFLLSSAGYLLIPTPFFGIHNHDLYVLLRLILITRCGHILNAIERVLCSETEVL